MTVATNHQQHRTAQCRGGQGPVAATRTAHSPAALNKHQDRSAFRGRAGFFVRRTLLHGSSSQVTEPGLRARPFSHVGWCFNTARDFGSFPPLRLVKGLWLAWKSTSELRRARAQTSPPKITTSRENGRGPEQ